MEKMTDCPECGAKPGEAHKEGCDVERCSVCGGQRLQCNCEGHDPAFARWSGFWPGQLEAEALGIDLNGLEAHGVAGWLFVKPEVECEESHEEEEEEDLTYGILKEIEVAVVKAYRRVKEQYILDFVLTVEIKQMSVDGKVLQRVVYRED
jgi:ABC-type ATPase with predicted acetyltransferase domain